VRRGHAVQRLAPVADAPHVRSAVAKLVGREVVAVLATVSLEPEVAVQFFMLGPQPGVARNEDRADG
jgi:hypothetical protein